MRLWSLHPRYLDSAGLVALWREALLAQAVLAGKTRGYRFHPQLIRFQRHPRPEDQIAGYLRFIQAQSQTRGFKFSADKAPSAADPVPQPVTTGQIAFERDHLLQKLSLRNRKGYSPLSPEEIPEAHPLFFIVAGEREEWEKG